MLKSPFTYFNKCYCINLASRPDRWAQAQQEFAREEIEVERFEAVAGDNPFLAFNTSQLNCIRLANKHENALIFEDDVILKNTMHLHYAMNELPEDWDLLFLGANILGSDVHPFEAPVRHSSHLFVLRHAWQTHAVGYSKRGMEKVLDTFKVDNGYNYDEWLRHNILPAGKSFIIAPQIAYQSPGYSDLWKNSGDYTSLFNRGNELLV